jgi:hypothetical protein
MLNEDQEGYKTEQLADSLAGCLLPLLFDAGLDAKE